MERTEIDKKVIEIVRSVCIFSTPDDPITEMDNLQNNLGFDDIDICEIAIKLEETFQIVILHSEQDSWQTVKDIIDYVEIELQTRKTV